MVPGLKTRVFSLHDVLLYLAIAGKYLRLMVLLICFAIMTGLTYYVFARPVYHSQSIVHVEDVSRPLDTDKLYQDGRFQSIPLQLIAPHILERTAKSLGVNANHRDLQRTYLTKIRAVYDSQANLIVDVWVALPELADAWTESMVREFLAYRNEKRLENRENLDKTYDVEIKEVLARIDRQAAERINLADERGLTEALIRLKSISTLPEDLAKLQLRLAEMNRIRVHLQDPSIQDDVVAKLSLIASAEELGDPLKVGTTVATNPTGTKKDGDTNVQSIIVLPSLVKSPHAWDTLLQEQEQLNNQVNELSKTFLPASSKMAEPLKKLAIITEKLQAEYLTAQRRFDLEVQQLINKRDDLQQKMPEYKLINDKYQKLLTEIGIYDQSQLPFQSYLVEMQKKRDALNYAGDKERINLEFGGLLESSARSVSPNRFKLLLVSLLVGVILALGVPFLIEYLDHTVGNLDEVESAFHLRPLGIVPQIDSAQLNPKALIAYDEDRKDALIENFRVIRTNLLSMGQSSKAPQVTMITSSMPKEGKTVVASNLAVSIAHTGDKTLLIDTDLRRGRLHRLFGFHKSPGLSNLLLGEISLEEACRSTDQPNLSVMTAGRHLESGTELLGSPTFRNLIQTLRTRFDRIIIDTPPVLGLSETSIMQNVVDGVIFVIWGGNTPARSAKAAVDMLTANHANFYGFVLNRIDLNASSNYYQYYYYSHDYYYQHPLENA